MSFEGYLKEYLDGLQKVAKERISLRFGNNARKNINKTFNLTEKVLKNKEEK